MLLAGVAWVPCISKNGVQDDGEGLAKTYLNAWKSGKVCCFHENCFPKRLLFKSEGLSHHYRIPHSQDHVSGDEEIKRRKNVLRKLMASETLNKLTEVNKSKSSCSSRLAFFCTVKAENSERRRTAKNFVGPHKTYAVCYQDLIERKIGS